MASAEDVGKKFLGEVEEVGLHEVSEVAPNLFIRIQY